jgi:hypothetical protein
MAYTKPRSNSQGTADTTAELSQLNGRPGYTVLVKDIGIFEWLSTGTIDGSNIFAGSSGVWSKVNDGTVPTSGIIYSVYTALLSFDGSTITTTVLQNTLGQTITWTNPLNGVFRATSTGTPFTVGKTFLSNGGLNSANTPYIATSIPRSGFATTTIDYSFFLYDGTLGVTPDLTNFPIEIRVYP